MIHPATHKPRIEPVGGFGRGDVHSKAGALCTGDQIAPAVSSTILLVEDEQMLLSAVARALKKNGFSVLAAPDGDTAVDQLRLHGDNIGLLFLDVVLPGLSSREVLEEARRSRPDMPVILASAMSRSVVDSSFAGLQVNYFVNKPYRLSAVMDLMRHVLA